MSSLDAFLSWGELVWCGGTQTLFFAVLVFKGSFVDPIELDDRVHTR